MPAEKEQTVQAGAPGSATGDSGKKVFFLYPPSVVQGEVISRLLEMEYEVYVLKDHVVARRVLRAYPDSIVFVNIEDGLNEPDWAKWIAALRADPVTERVGVGILAYNADEGLQEKYLMNYGARCGFVRLRLGAEESVRILAATLQANEAKGRRKYIRALCEGDALTSINVKYFKTSFSGTLRDVSSVGFSCKFAPDPALPKNTLLDDIQLKLHGVLLNTEGVVFGHRTEADGTLYVILFTSKMDARARAKVRKFIQVSLQADIDRRSHTL